MRQSLHFVGVSIVAMAALCSCAFAKSNLFPNVYDDPFIWDDLVVRGTVKAIAYETVPAEDWFPQGTLRFEPGSADLQELTMSITEVFRGSLAGSEVTLPSLRASDPRAELKFNERVGPGTEVIVTARYYVEKARYAQGSVFVRVGSGWSQFWDRDWEEPVSETELRARIAKVSLEAMTRASDLVVKGTILSANRFRGADENITREYVVSPQSVIKGSASGNIRVRVGGSVNHDEAMWRVLLPFDLEEGSTWYLFLTKHGDGYIPAAASRSAFRVSGETLFENYAVPSKYDPRGLEREVRRFVSE